MKSILIALAGFAMTFVTTVAFAQGNLDVAVPLPHTIWVQGQGSSFGQCDGMNSTQFCFNNLERQAEQSGRMNTNNQCYMQGGQVIGYANCYNYCTPNYIPPGSQMQMVNCHSNCSMPCQIRGLE